jgi:hypothetical protein
MGITCQDQRTISTVSILICGHLVKISDQRVGHSTIDVQIANQIFPQVGLLASHVGSEIWTLQLISKNDGAGTAVLKFTISDDPCIGVTCPDACAGSDLQHYTCDSLYDSNNIPIGHKCVPDGSPIPNAIECAATHVFEIGIKPYSWYAPSDALNGVISKLGDINGALINAFTSITDYQYLGVDTIQDGNNVVIRMYLKKLSTISSMNPIAWVPLIIIVAVIILAIGPIIYYKVRDWYYQNILSIRTYTPAEVNQIIWGGGEFGDGVVTEQLKNCDTNFAGNPLGLRNCYKSVICGAADGTANSLGITIDCTSRQVNAKIDACYAQYLIDGDFIKYKTCMTVVKTDTGNKLQTEADKKTQGGGLGILAIGLIGLTVLGVMMMPKKGEGTIVVKAEK